MANKKNNKTKTMLPASKAQKRFRKLKIGSCFIIPIQILIYLIVSRIQHAVVLKSHLFLHASTMHTLFVLSLCTSLLFIVLLLMFNDPEHNLKDANGILKKIYRACIVVFCFFLILPYVFIKSGLYIDRNSIKKVDFLGNVKHEYLYSDIVSCEVSCRYSLRYELVFNDGEAIDDIYQNPAVFAPIAFGNSANLKEFNELIDKHCVPKWVGSYQITREMFDSEEHYMYFKEYEKNHWDSEFPYTDDPNSLLDILF